MSADGVRKKDGSDVSLVLSIDEALVLYEFLTRAQTNDDYGHIEDQAELRVLWDLQAMLESSLVEPMAPEYSELLAAARSRVLDSE